MANQAQSDPSCVGDLLKYETDPEFCRAVLTLKALDVVSIGECLEPNGAWPGTKVLATAGNVHAIALEAKASSASTQQILALVRGPALVRKEAVTYNGETEATVDAALLVKNILVKADLEA